MFTYHIAPKPDKPVFLQHSLSYFLPVHESLNHACVHFFEEYMMLPDVILLSALTRIQLPPNQWEIFLCYGSYPIRLHHPHEPLIQRIFPRLFLPYDRVLCLGRMRQSHTTLTVSFQDTTLVPIERFSPRPYTFLERAAVRTFHS